MKKKHPVRNFLIFLLFVSLIGLSYYIYEYSDFFVIKEFYIKGNILVKPSELEELISDDLHYFKTNQYTLEDHIKSHPLIKTCAIEKVFPNGLDIKIIERTPIIAVAYSGAYLLIDEDMIVVKTSETSEGLYEISGYVFETFFIGCAIDDENSDVLRNAIDLAFMVMDQNMGKPEIIVEDRSIHLILEANKIIADFGEGKYVEKRFNDMIVAYKALVKDGNDTGVIDVRFDVEPTLKPLGDLK